MSYKKFMISTLVAVAMGITWITEQPVSVLAGSSLQTSVQAVAQADTNMKAAYTGTNSLPTWLVEDLKIASHAKFPIEGQTYGLNYVEGGQNQEPTWLGNTTPYPFWFGEYTGTEMQRGHTFYTGVWDFGQLLVNLQRNPSDLGKITKIMVLENSKDIKGFGYLTPAVSIDVYNGQSLAFAPNQVITQSSHAGVNIYTVYHVQGIKLPNRT